MSIIINQELNNIKNGVNNLNIVTTDNTQAILDETTRATTAEGALTTETDRLADEQNLLIGHNIHYGFRVCGTIYQSCNSGDILIFDNKTRTDYGCHVVPDASAYNTSKYKYTVPINGYYFFGSANNYRNC